MSTNDVREEVANEVTQQVSEDMKGSEEDVGPELISYMNGVIETLREDQKFPAVHTYNCTLRSFIRFSAGEDLLLPNVFTPGRLKEYEEWLLIRSRGMNTVSTYMRNLRAVYNRWTPPGSFNHNPKLFDNVCTRVISETKRALTNDQAAQLLYADLDKLTDEQRSVYAYFLLMFLLRGMPFIDLAHIRRKDVKDGKIVYRRHKTGKQMTVQIPPEAVELIEEYRDKNKDAIYLFPILDARLRGSWEKYKSYQDALRHFNKILKQAARILLPGVKVSSYTARHTWATLAFHSKMSASIISHALGHSSFHVTETYLKPFENETVDEANFQLISSVRKRYKEKKKAHNRL